MRERGVTNASSELVEDPNRCADSSATFEGISALPDKEKHTAYYSSLVGAWIETRMERDKSLLALSTAGIGLLFTLLTTVGAGSTRMIVLYGVCFVCFLISIVCAITIFGWNATLIQCLLRNEVPNSRRLDILDKAVFGCFVAGLILTVVLGIATGMNKLKTEDNHMGDGIKTTQQIVGSDGQKSLSGLDKLSPSSQCQGGQSSVNPGAGGAPTLAPPTTGGGQPSPAQSSQSSQGKK